jgi:hypothetical protein
MESKVALRNEFIDDNAHLFWYIKKDALHNISDEVLVEFIMNYGELNQIKRLFDLVGEKKISSLIKLNLDKVKNKERQNYRLSILNLFDKYFQSNGTFKYS